MDISEPLGLAQLAEGELGERFDLALEEALANTLDPNRDAGKTRKLVITVALKPDEASAEVGVPTAAVMDFDVKTVLAPVKPVRKRVHLGREKGTGLPKALLVDPAQHSLFKSDEPAGVVPISKATEGGNS